jgi:rSAM/selenodomain-associated transferase 1
MSVGAPPPALLVFAKEPVPGKVKSRLAQAIGAEASARVYRDLLATTLAHGHAAWRSRVVDHLELWCASDGDIPFLRGIGTAFGATRYLQSAGDLGQRMAHAMRDAFTRASSLLLIGSDCPLLQPARLAEAAAALRTHDAVLVPAEDGGYVLVGARRELPLADVRWSTTHALADTVRGFVRAGIAHATLPACWDVDDAEGLARFDALRKPPTAALPRR